jgi:hypothetical protein
MERISNTDRLVALLKLRLQERSKASSGAGADRKTAANAQPQATAVRGIAAIEGVDERTLRRAFIQDLLADQFGPALINDSQFQQVVTRVVGAIEDDPETSGMVTRLLSELRSP